MKKEFNCYTLNLNQKRFSKMELVEFLSDADCAIVGLDEIDNEVLRQLPKLKCIAKYGVGLDNIDLNACQLHDIFIGWTGGVNKRSVAELSLANMLMLSRNIYMTSNELKNGIWNKSGGFNLTGKNVGIIGVGHVGKELVKLLKPFDCTVYVNDIIEQDDYYNNNNLTNASKTTIYEKCDIVTLHIPLTNKTKNMINLETLKKMKRTSILINTARGGIINENDLKYALQSNLIGSAAIDTYLKEPPSDKEFLSLPNLICTPHIGGNSIESIEAMGQSAIEHIKKFIDGNLLKAINRERD